jgi:hypothetical protein
MNEALVLALTQELSANPSRAGDYLAVISAALKAYETTQAQKRNNLADRALLGCMDPVVFRKSRTGFTLPAIYHQFPNGKRAHAPKELECFSAFIEKVREEYTEDPRQYQIWLSNIQGTEVLDWFNRYILPEIQ